MSSKIILITTEVLPILFNRIMKIIYGFKTPFRD